MLDPQSPRQSFFARTVKPRLSPRNRAATLALAILPGLLGCAAPSQSANAKENTELAPVTSANPHVDHSVRLTEACAGRDGWADPAPPVHVYGNTWYVGTCGISALLVTGPRGDVLIDGGVPEAAPLVAANIEKLGVKLHDVRWIIATHDHFDHVGAIAQLQRMTGAKVAALPVQARVLTSGKPDIDDPQRGSLKDFAPVRVTRLLKDGAPLDVGPLRFTPHATPAHAPGSTSWTWQSCEGGSCRTIAYLDSATVISADGYRFTDHPARVAAARQGLSAMAGLPCDILLTPHPSASDAFARIDGIRPLVDPAACRNYAQAAETRLTARLRSEHERAP